MGPRLAALFGVEQGEGRPVTLMVTLYFVISAAFVLVQTTAFALFVEEFGSRSLPYAYLSVAFLSSLVAYIYLRFSQRVSFAASLSANLFFLSATCIVFWAGLRSPLAHWFIFLLPFWFQTMVNLANLVVWHLAGHMFNVRQAKRVYGLIASGTWLANILGGFAVVFILVVVRTADLYLLAAIALLLATLVLRPLLADLASRHPGERRQPATRTAKPSASATSPLRHPYSRLIFAYTLLWWVAFCFIDIIFFDRAGIQLPSGKELATFLGWQLAVMGVIAIVTASFLTSRIVSRYGLLAGLLVMPVAAVASITLLAVAGTLGWSAAALFWIATAAKTLNVALGFSISQATGGLLFQPLLGTQRSSTQTVAEGIIQPMAFGVAGIILLVSDTALHFSVVGLSCMFLVVAAFWFWTIFRLAQRYPVVMSEALLKRSLGEARTVLFDPSAIEQLRRSLRHPQAGLALYALNQLEQLAPQAWGSTLVEELPALLSHPVPEVRLEVLKRVFALQPAGALPIVRRRLAEEATPHVYSMLIQVLAGHRDPDSAAQVLEALVSKHPSVRRGAIVGLLSSGNQEYAGRASDALVSLAESAVVEERLTAAAILGECNTPDAPRLLLTLMRDQVASVRHAAIRAAAGNEDRVVLEALLAACDSPDSAHVAERVLVSKGTRALGAISEAFAAGSESSIPRARWHSMIRVLSQIHDPRSIDMLVSKIGVDDSQLRLEALLSLSRLGFRSRSTGKMLDLVTAEARLAAWLARAIQALPGATAGPDLGVLRAALEMAFLQTRNRILLLLSFVYNSAAMLRAHAALEDASTDQSPVALEIVDAQLPPRAKPLVLPLLENLSYQARLTRWGAAGMAMPRRRLSSILGDLIEGRPQTLYAPWTRLCAMYAAAQLHKMPCVAAIEGLQADPDPVVREMSRWSLAKLGLEAPASGGDSMLSPVERVLILKSAPIFAGTPDNVLADVAGLVEEMSCDRDQTIFDKGDHGDSLYVIVSGSVKVWDGDRLLNELGEGEVFGELALLDPEPRLATVKAAESTRLLRLDEAHFREVLTTQPEVSAAIIRVITRYLRAQLQYARAASAKLQALESFGFLGASADAA